MALPLSDNRADQRFKDGVESAHIPYYYGVTGTKWELKNYDSNKMLLTFPPGVEQWGDTFTSVTWLRPQYGGPWQAAEGNVGDFQVTPGETLKASIDLSLGGSWAGITARHARLAIFFRGASATYGSSSVVGWSTAGLTHLEVEATVPEGVTNAYLMLQAQYGSASQIPNISSSLYIWDLYFGTAGPAKGGVAEVGAATEARLGIVSDVYSRSREKIQLKLAGVDDLVRSGHRIELAAAAMTSAPAVWTWRQITGPAVTLNPKDNTVDFTAPDVEKPATIRIGVFASSEDGRNRSDWHYFDLTVEPPMLRFQGEAGGDFTPRSPYLMGYSRGKREIWNDVVRPVTYEENPRHEVEVLDLGVPDDDVVFDTEVPRRMAAGGVWVNPETGDVFRNFGAGYNETDDTTASPRTSTYWVNPANGDILEWIED